MKTFLAIYRSDPQKGDEEWNKLSKEEMDKKMHEGLEAWRKWVEDHEKMIVYAGGPLGKTLQVGKSGITSVVNRDCGFVILEAESHEEAAKTFLNHPYFSILLGENVEIMECLPTPGDF